MTTTRIIGARMVSDGRQFEGDLRIRGARIDAIGGQLPGITGERVIDAEGALLLPGMIDDQFSIGRSEKYAAGEIATESRAAVGGGITSFVGMPWGDPATTSNVRLRARRERAAQVSMANYGFALGATRDNLEEIKTTDSALACAVSVAIGAADLEDLRTLEEVFAATPLLVTAFCEARRGHPEDSHTARSCSGPEPRSAHPAKTESTALAIDLARRHDAQLHLQGVATSPELKELTTGPVTEKQITAAVCVPNLVFNETWFDSNSELIGCSPAIQERDEQLALITALCDDRLDAIATNHEPYLQRCRAPGKHEGPTGVPVAQQALPALLQLHKRGQLSLERVVEKACHTPAVRHQIAERGFLREGYFADLVMIDAGCWPVDQQALLSKCGWTPFAGFVFAHAVRHTWVNGELAFSDGLIRTRHPAGRALVFSRQP